MSIQICKNCNASIDTDFNAEDINDDEICINCIEEAEEDNWFEKGRKETMKLIKNI